MSPNQPVHNAEMDRILERHVDEQGLVDYGAEELIKAIGAYSDVLASSDIDALDTKDKRLAFWINAYNMLVIKGVIDTLASNPKWVERGNSGIGSKLRFFTTTKYVVAGKTYSLYQIENSIIRKGFFEPRIHFALVCAALSCPILKRRLFNANTLDYELEEAARDFINGPRGGDLDKVGKKITLSRIFRMYQKDFGKGKHHILKFVARYHGEGAFIDANLNALKVEYMRYDWTPNIKL